VSNKLAKQLIVLLLIVYVFISVAFFFLNHDYKAACVAVFILFLSLIIKRLILYKISLLLTFLAIPLLINSPYYSIESRLFFDLLLLFPAVLLYEHIKK